MGAPLKSGAKGFFEKLSERARSANSLLCIGLDPRLPNAGAAELLTFGRRTVEATHQAACAYKPNSAFYEARGPEGLRALQDTINFIHTLNIPVILDAKRGDISSTAAAYATAAFDVMGADALTVNPYLGGDSIEPFTSREGAGVFILCHTSNPGARDVQELSVDGAPLYERVARLAGGWGSRGNVGLVVGATFPEELARVRRIVAEMWLLLPGIGSQGGDLEASLRAALRPDGLGALVNVSRGVCEAADPGLAARTYRDDINRIREELGASARGAPGAGTTRDPLIEKIAVGLHDIGAVRFGQFTLKSGLPSPIYVDLRLLVSSPALLAHVGRSLAEMVSGLAFDRIAAIPYGGLPIGTAVSLASGKPLIYPRKEIKAHGTKQAIEGTFKPGETALVLDDLISTGGSKLEAMEPLQAAGLTVRDVAVLIDRGQGGARELSAKGLRLHALFTLNTLLDVLVGAGRITAETRAAVLAALGSAE